MRHKSNNEYLVVWQGYDGSPPALGHHEVYGQRVNGVTGAEIGSDFRLSSMGSEITTDFYRAYTPAVAYNSTDNEYLVVWSGDDDTGDLADEEYEVFGQRLAGLTGAEVGSEDFRLSDMGTDGSVNYHARDPAVAYNSVNNDYLVVWEGDDNTGDLVTYEYEIYGQRVNASTGAEIGGDVRLSDMGPDGDVNYDAKDPAVAYNSFHNEYLVVWAGYDGISPMMGEHEIYGQRVSAGGTEVGPNDFRLSSMGPIGNENHEASGSAVAYNSTDNESLVVWYGDDIADTEYEIYGQRVDMTIYVYLPLVLR